MKKTKIEVQARAVNVSHFGQEKKKLIKEEQKK